MKDSKKEQKNKKTKMSFGGMISNIATGLLIFLVIAGLYTYFADQPKIEDISISQLVGDIKQGLVSEIKIDDDQLFVTYQSTSTEPLIKRTQKETAVGTSELLINLGVNQEELSKVSLNVTPPSGWAIFVSFLPLILPLILIFIVFWYFGRQVRGAGMQAFTFGQSRARFIDPSDTKQKVTFKDVAGAREAKEELFEIVDFLKSPKKFLAIGARIPKGVLMVGPSGTGKTLLARAVAGEAGVPFFSVSGSEFVEMFVGVGASRVRDLFKMAKVSAPSIIFIDEIDAVGRARGIGVGGGNDEREQTLNQILVEMDGFEPNEGVIVMAATNRPDVLDPAILRPGRFDRRIMIDLPDRRDREAIMNIHLKGKPLAEDINVALIAERTPGFSGADLYSLVNEAAILAARENRKHVAQFDLIRSIEKVMLGPERKSHLLTQKEKEITAYHEAGHALVASLLPNADPVHKISIVARGRAGGYTLKLPVEDRKLQSRKEFVDDLAMSLGGYAAEEIVFGDVTTGPQNDLRVATALARDMVTRFGMSSVFGPIAFENDGRPPIFGSINEDGGYSERVASEIDSEVAKLLKEAHDKAKKLLNENRKILNAITNKLIEVETLEREAYEQILSAHGVSLMKHEEDGIENLDIKRKSG